ncbi:Hpt domain-containing protein [Pseudacidovorax intermedius]|uniref:Chemotaxis protein CheA n=1 Tax=Pseudacidovorax intermedius TaxID=433924 RepID=A0A147H1D4_9BURK|nr:Hpt domain-containing protein [Pseudacidovorax intermedius]KTT23470.1 hypothetical protein NS331_07215 [Pseudacidovorax intermedius]
MNVHPASAPPAAEPATTDLGPLAWVHAELRKSLEEAVKALYHQLQSTQISQYGQQGRPTDDSELQAAAQHLHQAAGALQMVGQGAAARLAGAMEAAVQRMRRERAAFGEEGVVGVERASFALADYLARRLAGRPAPALGLFPAYRDMLALAGAERIHPADLWTTSWAWPVLPRPENVPILGLDAQVRTGLDRELLQVVKSGSPEAARRLAALCLRLMAGAPPGTPAAGFWLLAGAFFESVAAGVLDADAYVRRTASRVMLQYAALARGPAPVADRLGQDLLFFCAQARQAGPAPQPQPQPLLTTVRRAWGLGRTEPVDYEQRRYGRFDPALLAQARRRVEAAKACWSTLSEGDLNHLRPASDSFAQLGESLMALYPAAAPLVQAFDQALAEVIQRAEPPSTELALEVATALLHVEAAFDDLDPQDREVAGRIVQLATRIESAREGRTPEPLAPWMEALYHRVSDRQSLGTVVDELRVHLAELEKALDQFFRRPGDGSVLRAVPGQLTQMRGVLSVLGVDQAARAVLRMREDVEGLLLEGAGKGVVSADGPVAELLGHNLGALGFLIDMLAYQAALARRLFVFDEASGRLNPIMGRQAAPPGPAVPHAAELPVDSTQVVDAQIAQRLAELGAPAGAGPAAESPTPVGPTPAAAMPPAAAATPPATAAAPGGTSAEAPVAPALEEFSRAAERWNAQPPAAAPAAATPTPIPTPGLAVEELGEDDLRDIFLDEAREVLAAGRGALDGLRRGPAGGDGLTVLRRAFHTLKGSARMVALADFGEAAWACEQVLNTWLAEQRRADAPLLDAVDGALAGFGGWVEAIAADTPPAPPAPWLAPMQALIGLPAHPPAAAPAAAPLPVFEPDFDAVTQPAPLEPLPAEPAPPTLLGGLDLGGPTGPAELDFLLPDPPAPARPAPRPLDASSFGHTRMEAELADDEAPTLPAPLRREPASAEAEAEAPPTLAPMSRDEASNEEDLPPAALTAVDFELSMQPPEPAPPPAQVLPAQAPVPQASAVPPAVEPPLAAEAEAEAAHTDADAAGPAGLTPLPALEPVPAVAIGPGPTPFLHTAAFPDAAPFADGLPFTDTAEFTDTAGYAVTQQLHRDDPPPASVSPGVSSVSSVPSVPTASSAEAMQAALAGDASRTAEAPDAGDAGDGRATASATAGPGTVGEALDPAAPDAPPARSEDVRLVGGLRIPAALYNVYLAEAEDWSGQLAALLGRWAQAPADRLPDEAVAAAHSLAGSSATVGFMPLSELARSLEHALEHLQGSQRAGDPQAAVLLEAADDIRRLLHQFAAGFVKPPAPGLVERLRALLAASPAPAAAAEPAGPDVALEPEDELGAVQDAVDHELFPIFEEEAADLLPALSAALRAWADRPDDAPARDAALRALHTLKGSARLAGAMRLGQRAHQMESALEPLAGGEAARAGLAQALARLDALQADFDRLRAADTADEARRQQLAADTVAAEHSAPALQLHTGETGADADSRTAATDPATDGAATAGPPGDTAAPAAGSAHVAGADMARDAALAAAIAPAAAPASATGGPAVRIRAQLLDRLMAEAGEVIITRGRIEASVEQLRGAMGELTGNLQRLRQQLRDIEVQAESQMQSRQMQSREGEGFDPLEFDRFTRVQELARMMAESVDDVAAVHRTLQRTVQVAEDGLQTQARQTRELQRSLLRTRMVAFDNLAERLYRVVRQASKETGKPVNLDLLGGQVEMDRGVLDRVAPAFEHLLRNAVVHGIEPADERERAGKPATGQLQVEMRQEGNDVAIRFSDDGGGLRVDRIRARAEAQGLVEPGAALDETALADLVFRPGFSTAEQVSELAGRGIGMDVVRAEVTALGGRIETRSTPGRGTEFRLVLPLTTAVTQVLMLRAGDRVFGVPASLVELVQRTGAAELAQAYGRGEGGYGGETLPFYWAGALLQASDRSDQLPGRANTVVVVRSAAQRVLLHVDEVLGSQEVVVKNLGPQLSRVPGLVGMTVLASGAVVMIHNPVVLGTLHGGQARRRQRLAAAPGPVAASAPGEGAPPSAAQVPLVLVVDDSITVRRVTQRLLQREGWRVALAADGLQALELLQRERPALVLSDIEMPRMDGFDLVRNIRADAQLAGLPVVMITSRIAGKHREHAQHLGVDHYLGKPYGEDELLALVRRYAAPVAAEQGDAPPPS